VKYERAGVLVGLTLCLPCGGCDIPLLPDFATWLVDAGGYEIERLPTVITASYAKGNEIYLVDNAGQVLLASDDQSGRIFVVDRSSGQSQTITAGSQLMWFSVADAQQVFVGSMVSKPEGGEHSALLASPDEGRTWQKVMVSDEPSTGHYSHDMFAESRNLSAGGWLYFTMAGPNSVSFRIRRTPF